MTIASFVFNTPGVYDENKYSNLNLNLNLKFVKVVLVVKTVRGKMQISGPIAERSKSSDLDCGRGPGFKSRWG